MHLVGFIIRIDHEAWSSECQSVNKFFEQVLVPSNTRYTLYQDPLSLLTKTYHQALHWATLIL